MPEHIRSMVVILALAMLLFALIRRPACQLVNCSDFTRRRNLWISLTIIAFLAHNFWAYALIGSLVLYYNTRSEKNPVALFFFILFAVPSATTAVSGLGVVNYIIVFNHPRLIVLIVLLPTFIALLNDKSTVRFGRTLPDKLITAYLLLSIVLHFRNTTLTDTLRQSVYLGIDIFLPYFVISRSLKSIQDFRDAILSLVIACMILALTGLFESVRHWRLYSPLLGALDIDSGLHGYLSRDHILRASSAVGQPIVLGYVMVVAIGFYLFLKPHITSRLYQRLGIILLILGLIASLSRGPWVGFVALLVVFIITGPRAVRHLSALTLAASLSFAMLFIIPGGQRVINLLPFVGETGESTISYRQELIANALTVIKRNPWFGDPNYLEAPEMEAMRQGHGIIDVVNTYLGLALEMGVAGLILFLSFFLVILAGVYRGIKSVDKGSDERLLGRSFLASLASILVIIFTVSSISIIPIVYWSVAAMGVAYIQMIKKRNPNNAK
ncbi:MAG: O-antigen ligase family protein [Candidatus Sedimenticola sp. (ex Thyasira tokunagai)]